MGSIPISISPMFWLVAGGLGWLNTQSLNGTLSWMVVIFISVMVHEYGHALTARYFGQRASISLLPFGGVTHRQGKKLSFVKEFLIILNGPVAGFCLAGVAYFLFHRFDPATQPQTFRFFYIMAFINVLWTVINLIPVGFLDGGQLLKVVLEAVFGITGVRLAHIFGFVLGVLLAVVFMIYGWLFLGILFFILAFESGRAWKSMQEMTQSDTNEDLQKMYHQALGLEENGRNSAALDLFRQVRKASGKGVLNRASAQAEAHLLAKQGDEHEAIELLEKFSKTLDINGLHLYHHLLVVTDQWQKALKVGTEIFLKTPDLSVAILNARCSAQLADVQQTAGWLESAKSKGLEDLSSLINQTDFDKVRNQPRIQKLLG